jgi:non-specific serine/threonine protein kinase
MEHESPAGGSTFGELLRRHRLEGGLSQEALAERARMSARGIGALERGDRRTPQRETVLLLADALALSGEQRRAFEAAANPVGSRLVKRGSVTAGPWPSAPSSNLPLWLTTFVGREAEVAQIDALARGHRLVTVTGPGGIGKTRTALRVGAALKDAVSGGVWLAELGSLSDGSRVAGAIAAPLGVQESPNRKILDELLTFLERRQLLIVLDNCEHVIDEVRHVVIALLLRCPGLRFLATSREALNIAGERRYVLGPLPFPSEREVVSAQHLLSFDAPALFMERAAAVNGQFAVNDENAASVAQICRRLDGMPLALELVAARINMFSPQELTRRLDDRFRLLTIGDPTAPPRQRTIRALIDWSYDLLSPDEQSLFRMFGVFAGGFTLETAAAAYGLLGGDDSQTMDLLSSLVDKSLVQPEPEGGRTRYRLLESVQHYARERLEQRGDDGAAARAHARAFLALAKETEATYGTAGDREWAARVLPEMENWGAALRWSLAECADVGLGLDLTATMRWVWIAFAQAEGRRWTPLALQRVDATTPSVVIARLHLFEAHSHAWLGQYKASYDAAERARPYLDDSADVSDLAEVGWRTGNALVLLEEVAEGERRLQASLSAYRQVGYDKMVCWVLICIAIARAYVHDTDGAKACYAEALAIAKTRQFVSVVLVVLGNLAEAEYRSGDAEAAVRCAAEALAGSRETHTPLGCAIHLCNMAAYLVSIGRFDEAQSCAHEALGLSRDLRAELVATVILQHLAATAALRSNGAPGEASDDRARAARLLGYVDARLDALHTTREFTEAREYDALIGALSAAFGAEPLANLMDDGRKWTDSTAYAEAQMI